MTASTDVPTLHAARLAPAVALDLQLESYANGMQAPVWMWMPIFAIVHRRGGEVGFLHSPSAGAALAHHVHTPIHTPVHTIHTRVHTLVHTLFRSTCTHRPTAPPSWTPRRRVSGERAPR